MIRVGGAALFLLVTILSLTGVRAVEDTWDYSVQADSAVEMSPPKITLSWRQDTNGAAASYTIFRKDPGANSWGAGQKLPGSATSFEDTAVVIGRAYEYRIVKATKAYTGYGYVQTGINVPLVENRGTVALIVDHKFATSLALELFRLQQDLVGDGWTVRRHDVIRTDSVVSVKAVIEADYETDPNLKSVFLFGHVPVPYSGKLNPDNHPDHVGAWPADVYYGDMHGVWTDRSVNYHQTLNSDRADAARLSNVPGDGKFDQSTIPGAVELEVGRVDLANMPGRSPVNGAPTFASEEELLRQYLNKDHAFRHGQLNVQRRAIIGDYFGVRGGEAFSASGYRSFSPLVGPKNISNLNVAYANDPKGRWIPALAANAYLLAYGCGPGTYQTIDGIGNSNSEHDGNSIEIVSNNIQAVFTLIFGSWLGDWDHEDDIMRSVLAAPSCSLATAWSGRPHWFVHPLGLGETLGYTARLTQNNTGLYQNEVNSSAHLIHIALMGDPTLRLHPVVPVSALGGATTSTGTTLAWDASPDQVVGYHVYRARADETSFTRLTSEPSLSTSFVDAEPSRDATYMVRAVKLESTPSGSYFNASQGIFWSAGPNLPRATDRVAASPTIDASARRSVISPVLATPTAGGRSEPTMIVR